MALLEMNSGGNGAVLGGEAHWAPGAAAMAYAAAAAVAAGIPAPSGTTPSRAVAAFYPAPPHPAGHQHFTSAQSQFDEYVASNGNNDGDFLSAGYPSSSSKEGAADTNYYSQLFQLRQSEENALRGCGAIPPYEMDTTSIEGKQQGTSAVGGGSFFPQQAYPPPPPHHHQHISAATEWRGSDIYLRVGATLEIGASAHSLMEQNCWLPAHPGHQLALPQHSQQQLAIAGGFSHPHHFQTPPDNDLPGATHQTLFKGNGFKGGPLHVHQQSTGLEGISASHSLALARPIGSQANLEGRMKQQRAPERRSNQQQQSGATRSYACAMCAKQYCRKSTLRAHMKQQHHLGDRPFSCQICGKHFSQAANLAAHRRVHTGEKPFHCPVCHRPFSQSSSLVTHKRTHTGERPYPCPHCDKAFTDSSTLTKHLRTHTGQKPYSCALCMMKFSQSGNLHRHMKTHMNGVMPPH